MAVKGDGVQRNSRWILLFRSILLLLLTSLFVWVWYSEYAEQVYIPFFRMGNYLVILLYAILLLNYENTYHALDVTFERLSNLVFGQILSIIFSNFIAYLIIILLIRSIPRGMPLVGCSIVQFVAASLWCKSVKKWYVKRVPSRNTVVVYYGKDKFSSLVRSSQLSEVFDVKESYNKDVFLGRIREDSLPDMDTVILVNVPSSDRNEILKYCIEKRISVYTKPKIGDALMNSASDKYLFHLPFLCVNGCNAKTSYFVLKRLFDIVLSFVVLVVLSPLLVVVAILIKISDGGPIFYKQTRLTKDGRTFEIYKFRSMCVDAEKNGVAVLSAGENDDRITTIGRFIRKCRIDELPQLINILLGDMSIVGPRPERPEIAAEYEKSMPEFSLRLQMKAGLTGLAQVYGKYNTTPYDKLLFDLMYIARPSLIDDLRIIFATFKILFDAESTEGFEETEE